MEQLVKMVSEKTGISEAQSQKAVQTVLSFIKDKLPDGMKGQLDTLLSGKIASGMGNFDDIKKKVGL